MWRGFSHDGGFDMSTTIDVLTSHRWWRVAWFTTWQAVVSTVATLAVGIPIAGVLARYDVPASRLVRALTTVPFVMPTIVIATAFIAVFDSLGPVGDALKNSAAAVILAHVYLNLAVVIRALADPWSRLDHSVEEAARTLGMGAIRTVMTVTLPRLRLAIGAAAAIVFLFTFTSFGIVLFLGGPTRTTLEVETYIQTTSYLQLDVASVLALTQISIVVATLATQRLLTNRAATAQQMAAPAKLRRPISGPRDVGLVLATVGAATVVLLAPMFVLVWRSVRLDGAFTLSNYARLWDTSTVMLATPAEAIWNSFSIAVVAMLLALTIGTLATIGVAYGEGWIASILDTALMVPLGTSAATLGFGFLIALDEPPLDLRTSAALVPIAHALIGIPFVMRLLVPTVRSIDPKLRETALLLGQSRLQVWIRVDAPVVKRALFAAAGFAFAVSLGEFGATAFIARPDRPTIPTAIMRYLGRPGPTNVGQAMAMATILMVVTTVAVAAIETNRVNNTGDF
ncbi:MAG: iron ABC transporter permease [Actinomycetia bacterium]|nr:iron ABC transporter permease [Actinomycetes bacterium]MCP4960974.1 iron ABC transporter permease [Actinomycetes bacterium]